jgi:MFS family permease
MNLLCSAARLRGFEEGLGLTGNQFATILSILYVGYIIMQVPSYVCYFRSTLDLLLIFCIARDRNMFLNHIGKPSIYLPVCMVLWGLISVLTGVTRDFTGALLTRFFLGICECAFFPVSYHWQMFYTGSHGMAGSIVPPFEMVQTQ